MKLLMLEDAGYKLDSNPRRDESVTKLMSNLQRLAAEQLLGCAHRVCFCL